MIWERKNIALGEVRVGKKKEIVFVAKGELDDVKSLSSSCGCSTPRINGNTIEVSYTPGAIPEHLRSQGNYTTSKKITVLYNNNTSDVLSFSATVKR